MMAHVRSHKSPFFLSDVGIPTLKSLVLLIVAEAAAVREQLAYHCFQHGSFNTAFFFGLLLTGGRWGL